MAIKKYDSTWKDISFLKRYTNGSWTDCSFVKVYRNNQWEQVWPDGKLYLIKNGLFSVPFTVVQTWNDYSIGDSFYYTENEGYIEIYNIGYYMGSLITSNSYDISKYSTINIEYDINITTASASLNVGVRYGLYSTNTDPLYKGHQSTENYGTSMINCLEFYKGSTTDGFISLTYSGDISGITSMAYISPHTVTWDGTKTNAYFRIKNLWLE